MLEAAGALPPATGDDEAARTRREHALYPMVAELGEALAASLAPLEGMRASRIRTVRQGLLDALVLARNSLAQSLAQAGDVAAAALSGVYRFEETQEKPVAVTWCGLTPKEHVDRDSLTEDDRGREEESETLRDAPAAGKKRKRDDFGAETDAAGCLCTRLGSFATSRSGTHTSAAVCPWPTVGQTPTRLSSLCVCHA